MTVNQSIRIGVVGCGAIAEIYHLPALAKHSLTKNSIVLADPNLVRLATLKDQFSAAEAVTDYKELEGRVDGVIVATPPALHYPVAKWFLQRGIHVLSEKPLTESGVEARDLVETARANGVGLAVNQTRRFYPTYAKIRQLIADGELGTLKSIKYHEGFDFDWPAASPHHFSMGAKGVWSDTGVHLLDAVCYWLDAKPELIDSSNDSQGGPEALATVQFRHDDCDIEIKVSRLGKLMNGFRIEGTAGVIEASMDEIAKVVVQLPNGKSKTYRCGRSDVQYTDHAHTMLANFVEVIQGQSTPHVSGESTLGTIALLEAAYDKAKPFAMPWNRLPVDFKSTSCSRTPADDTSQRILVTGASGFLGGRIVETMLMSGYATPVAAIRNWTRAARVARHPVELAIGDIEDPAQVDAAVAGVDAIVHCAKTDDRDSIVGGTRNLLEAAARHGVERFVYLSTAEVYGAGVSGTINESAPTPMTGRMYGDAKLEAEGVCREFYDRGVGATILRPSIIYGPFSASWSVTMAKRLQSGNWGTFDACGDGIANLIYVDDLVRAILLTLAHPDAIRETYNISGPERVTWNDYFSRFNDALELPPLRQCSPTKSRLKTKVMDKIDFVADKVMDRFEDKIMEIYLRRGPAGRMMKWLKGQLSSTPSGDELNDLFARDAVYTDAKIREQLGFESAFDLGEGLKNTVDWMRLHELADPSQVVRSRENVDASSLNPQTMEAVAR